MKRKNKQEQARENGKPGTVMGFSIILLNNLMDYFVFLCGLATEYKNWLCKRARKTNKKVIEKFTTPKQHSSSRVNGVVAQ